MRFQYSDESRPRPVPDPDEASRSRAAATRAATATRSSSTATHCKLYELYALYPPSGGALDGGLGRDLEPALEQAAPRDWTSADAAGLPILPGLARYDEVEARPIDHALRFTVPQTRNAFIYPARHSAPSSTDPSLPAMGQRFRLKASFDIAHYPRQARIVLQALKRYGMIVADNGSPWYISGAPNRGWNNDDLHTLGQVKGSTSRCECSGWTAEGGARWLASRSLIR